MDIFRRAVNSMTWHAAVSVAQVIVGFARSVLLARLLAVETFGIYGMATSIVGLSSIIAGFGLNAAFLHRTRETQDEDQAAAVLLTLKLFFASAWAAVMTLASIAWADGPDRVALLTLSVVQWGILLCDVPKAILIRRVVHRRLALLNLLNLVLSAATAVFLAFRGVQLWALLSTDIITLVLNAFFLYLWRPVWRLHLAWSPSAMRYFLGFGSRNVIAQALLKALDKLDDVWTGAYLGRTALGFYSRAYSFATYPRSILASSVNKVSGGTYAELADDRKRLSKAFFRTNAFLVRSGFFIGGLLALVAPEVISLLLGSKWMPMLMTFRLMLVFTLFDPIKVTVANLFLAVGRPGEVVRARALQLAVMGTGLFTLGPAMGINGVALAVDAMLVVGIVALLWRARKYVDFSARVLFSAPAAAVILGLAVGLAAITLPWIPESPWCTGLVKGIAFTIVYGGLLLLLERRQIVHIFSYFVDTLLADKSRTEHSVTR